MWAFRSVRVLKLRKNLKEEGLKKQRVESGDNFTTKPRLTARRRHRCEQCWDTGLRREQL